MLRGEDLKLTYRDGDTTVDAVKDVSILIEDHQFIGILGPSGSGKSSLLYLLSGLRQQTQGEVYLDDRAYGKMSDRERVALRRTEFGFVFKQHFLINCLTALENVSLPTVFAGIPRDEGLVKAQKLLTSVGLSERIHHRPTELSAGQQQRVAIARAMANDPAIILADEPTGNLDTRSGEEIMGVFHKLHNEGATIVMVTHELDIAENAQRVIYLIDGRIASDREDARGVAALHNANGGMR